MRQVEFRASLSRSEFQRLGQNKSSAGWIAGAAAVALAWIFSAVGLGPAELDFGTRQVGLSNRQPVQLTNRGLTEFHAASIAMEGVDASDFAIAEKSCATVSAGESCAVWVDFKPRQSGEKHARLVVRTADGNELSSEFKGVATAAAKVVPPKPADDTKPDKPVHKPEQIAKNDPGPVVTPDAPRAVPENHPEKVDPGPAERPPVQPPSPTIPAVERPPVGPDVPPQRPRPPQPRLYAHVTMSPDSASFSARSADGEFFNATPQVISVTSDGTADVRQLRLGLEGAGSPFTVTPACPQRLLRGQRCTVQVKFAPRDQQTRSDSLVAYDGGMRLTAVPLSGSVTVPPVTGRSHVSFKPREVQFPVSQSDGWVRLTENVTVISDGTADVQRLTLNVGPQGGPFTLPGGCPPRLARGQTCTFQLIFDQKSWQAYNGRITAYDGNTALAALPLRGGGGQATGHPRLTVNPSALKLGGSPPTKLAYMRAGQNISARNDGDVDLRALAWTIVPAGGPFALRTNCSSGLARGQGCTVQVAFSARAAGQYQATLVGSEGGTQLATVQLYGSAANAAPPKQPEGYVTGTVDRAYPNDNAAPGNGAASGSPQSGASGNSNAPAKTPGQSAFYRQAGPNRAAAVSPQTQRAAPVQVVPRNVPQRRVQQKPPPPQIH